MPVLYFYILFLCMYKELFILLNTFIEVKIKKVYKYKNLKVFMKKKKVTLSVDSKVYSDFQKYCEENAIMLSRKIEIFMKEVMNSKKNRVKNG